MKARKKEKEVEEVETSPDVLARETEVQQTLLGLGFKKTEDGAHLTYKKTYNVENNILQLTALLSRGGLGQAPPVLRHFSVIRQEVFEPDSIHRAKLPPDAAGDAASIIALLNAVEPVTGVSPVKCSSCGTLTDVYVTTGDGKILCDVRCNPRKTSRPS